ncbi:hypothetical protein C5F48_18600 [Cereibacter changlensis JA139]|uniref:Uncharacterized protein n=2 Tax=Cereibacter changlensis TaxID=402884 RepID=A0A2T4JR27_9RHOB|nr:hypothetical protein [Cereibacter changlensis]PTE20247.1 hypothetical protein C5F48_18600 [Cereibacter changlensis JA139]PZX47752.1 hypothetical protein LX76_04400 [Cereibacter changlensis]
MLMHTHQTTTAKRRAAVEAKAWEIALRMEVFGYAEIAAELLIGMEPATDIVRGWEAAGRVRVQRGGNGNSRKMFELTPAYREPKDRGSQVSQQLWTAMRGLKSFTPVDLASHCRADLRVDLREASAYCQTLLRAKYLRVSRTAVPGKREATYRLVKNTGPRAPREKRVAAVWDPNDSAYSYVPGMTGAGK